MHADISAQAADIYRAETERAAAEERAARRARKEAKQAEYEKHGAAARQEGTSHVTAA